MPKHNNMQDQEDNSRKESRSSNGTGRFKHADSRGAVGKSNTAMVPVSSGKEKYISTLNIGEDTKLNSSYKITVESPDPKTPENIVFRFSPFNSQTPSVESHLVNSDTPEKIRKLYKRNPTGAVEDYCMPSTSTGEKKSQNDPESGSIVSKIDVRIKSTPDEPVQSMRFIRIQPSRISLRGNPPDPTPATPLAQSPKRSLDSSPTRGAALSGSKPPTVNKNIQVETTVKASDTLVSTSELPTKEAQGPTDDEAPPKFSLQAIEDRLRTLVLLLVPMATRTVEAQLNRTEARRSSSARYAPRTHPQPRRHAPAPATASQVKRNHMSTQTRRRENRSQSTASRRANRRLVGYSSSDDTIYDVEDVQYQPITKRDVAKVRKTGEWRIFPKYELTTIEVAQQEAELFHSFTKKENMEEVRPAEDGESACCICYENRPTRVVIPCGHRCLCFNCAFNIAVNRTLFYGNRIAKLCPICQAAIAIMPRLC